MALGSFFYDNALASWIYDRESLQFIEVNSRCLSLYGYSEFEFHERLRMSDLLVENEPKYALQVLEELLRSRAPRVIQQRRKNGTCFEAVLYGKPVEFYGRNCAFVTAIDQTEILHGQPIMSPLPQSQCHLWQPGQPLQPWQTLKLSHEQFARANAVFGSDSFEKRASLDLPMFIWKLSRFGTKKRIHSFVLYHPKNAYIHICQTTWLPYGSKNRSCFHNQRIIFRFKLLLQCVTFTPLLLLYVRCDECHRKCQGRVCTAKKYKAAASFYNASLPT